MPLMQRLLAKAKNPMASLHKQAKNSMGNSSLRDQQQQQRGEQQQPPLSPPYALLNEDIWKNDNNGSEQLTSDLPHSPPHSPTRLQESGFEPSTHAPILVEEPKTQATTAKTTPTISLHTFRLLRTIGTGSFGRVHLAQSKCNDRFYAIKVMKKSEIVRMKQIEHTRNERAILLSIRHPFIVNMWATFQDCAMLFMVMDYVPGGELFTLLRKNKRFSEDLGRFYAAEVLLALAYLHSKDIVYRDLKPENLLLDAEGHIKIADFGFAKHVPDVTWTLCGTPDYLAPEIIQSKAYGKAADYWSLGVLIYEMLAGYPPFYDDSQFKLYEKIITCRPNFPAHFSATVVDLLKHLLTTDLSSRFGNLKAGYRDVIEHAWFNEIDFEKLTHRNVKPPFVPKLKGDGDASNFDKYDEEKMPYGLQQADPYRKYFADF
ncbi:camp-dependent protein kinase catalytic subunit [Apophysomyces ossiformis]|uniref:cAMP-dependent protein kinase n=1 Tax=Apophysomyces ossiformis TaxID=679940 RepID=A0A8H7BRT4_9FUNG|nr:camp-dependent protein kinase catalytic subunit [Apophysomyces ossiformis]